MGDVLGGLASGAAGLFGTGTTQNTTQNQQNWTQFRPEDMTAVQRAQQNFQNFGNAFTKQAQSAADEARGAKTSLNVDFSMPQFNQPLDPTSQNLISGELARQRAATDAQIRQIGQRFGSQNPGVASILGQQAQNAGQLQMNPIAFAASQAQNQRLADQAAATNQAINYGNQAQLQQQGADLGRLQAAQGFGQQGLGAQQGILQQLLQLAQAFGVQNTTGGSTTKGRSGGLFS